MSWAFDPPDPPPPGSSSIDALRWLVIVMDCDGYLAFVAGCLAYAIEHDGDLTKKQDDACRRVFNHVYRCWEHGTLACQITRDHPLRDVEPEGHA